MNDLDILFSSHVGEILLTEHIIPFHICQYSIYICRFSCFVYENKMLLANIIFCLSFISSFHVNSTDTAFSDPIRST